jgi:hypothetical protein
MWSPPHRRFGFDYEKKKRHFLKSTTQREHARVFFAFFSKKSCQLLVLFFFDFRSFPEISDFYPPHPEHVARCCCCSKETERRKKRAAASSILSHHRGSISSAREEWFSFQNFISLPFGRANWKKAPARTHNSAAVFENFQ